MHLSNLLTILYASVFSLAGFGQEIPSDFRSVRALGMGGASAAVGNDEYAPYTNPAGIGRVRKPRSKDSIGRVSGLGLVLIGNDQGKRASSNFSIDPSERLDKLFEAAKDNAGKPILFETQLYPALMWGSKRGPTFLFGTTFRTKNEIIYSDISSESIENIAHVSSVNTAGVVFGIGGTTARGVSNWGLSVRPQYRYSLQAPDYDASSVSFSNFKNELTSKANQTLGIALDAGVQFVAADYWLPTLGIAVRNIPLGCKSNYYNPYTSKGETMCGTVFAGSVKNRDDPYLVDPTEVRIGLSITPRIRASGERINLRLTGDIAPLGYNMGSQSFGMTEIPINKMAHAGAELYFGDAFTAPKFALRGGISQGYPTFGASLSLLLVDFDFASYTEDVGIGAKRNGDRRYLLGITSAW